MPTAEALFYLWLGILGAVMAALAMVTRVIDWQWAGLIAGYVTIGSVALYLQHSFSVAALNKLAEAHQRNVADLHLMIEILQLALLNAQETHARPNRVTHAEAEL